MKLKYFLKIFSITSYIKSITTNTAKDFLNGFLIILGVVVVNLILVQAESKVGGSIVTFGEAFWYMAVTLTTVGYGDLYPQSAIGRIIGYLYVFSSVGFLGLLISKITSKYNLVMEQRKMGLHGTDFINHVILVGWTDFSKQVMVGLAHTSMKVCVITNKKDDVDLIYDEFGKKHLFVVFAELNNKEAYPRANASKARTVFFSMDDEAEVLIKVLYFKKISPKTNIIVVTSKAKLKETFLDAGVKYVVPGNEIVSKLVASYIFEPDVAELSLDLITTSEQEKDYDVLEFKVIESNPYINRDAHSIFHDIKTDYDAVLMAIRKIENGERVLFKNPANNIILTLGDYLLIMANKPIKDVLESVFGVKEGI